MREVKLAAPHFTQRVREALEIVEDNGRSPALLQPDREFLGELLRSTAASIQRTEAPEQLLHGEPHPGNLLNTRNGPRFIDLETCCRGPVEFDVASAPGEVADHYRGLSQGLLDECRTLTVALVAAWRWDRHDQFPDGRAMGEELLAQLRGRTHR